MQVPHQDRYVWKIRYKYQVQNMNGASFQTSMTNIGTLRTFSRNTDTYSKWKKTLQNVVPKNPAFIYRKAPNFGDKIVKKVLDPPVRPTMFWDCASFYACRRCKTCAKVNSPIRGLTEFTSTGNNMNLKIKDFNTCSTTHVVYVLQCPCNIMYLGRTKRTLKKRVSEHIYNIEIGYKDHSVSLHLKQFHGQDPSGLKFWSICPNWRGSNMVREISKSETRWIYLMNTLTPSGLNVELDVNCFISDY